MLQIRPVSDLRNKFSDIETLVTEKNAPIFLTKNGYGSMVLMSLSMYENLTENIEAKLDEADVQAENTPRRLSHDEVFSAVRARIKAN
ncbi:MAG: type II toxin-antitoxin system Phd/YefM family antitoxin [Spirochaetaceae bacterium]|nr:type II toxin-antitoxin system Phd/YefM family antitoxin [Spirochaetaceae bacterium]